MFVVSLWIFILTWVQFFKNLLNLHPAIAFGQPNPDLNLVEIRINACNVVGFCLIWSRIFVTLCITGVWK